MKLIFVFDCWLSIVFFLGNDAKRIVAEQRGRHFLHPDWRAGPGSGRRPDRVPLLVASRRPETQSKAVAVVVVVVVVVVVAVVFNG